ncbi:hypothetical protein A4S06_11115 [Erysipelotrichaceae bacterium MTC7]|nr:hypothetical protein A4S06_11115 [Erysipelotrichaceae bacterium MTC7]
MQELNQTSQKDTLELLDAHMVDIYTWAIFSYRDKTLEERQTIGSRIIYEWLPISGYEYDIGPDVAVHTQTEDKRVMCEYWLPIKKRQDNNDELNKR